MKRIPKIKITKENFIYLIFSIYQLGIFSLLFISHNLPMNIVLFSSIVLSFLVTLLLFKRNQNHYYQIGAISFTLIADIFLTLLGKQQTLAMFFFTIVQIFYLLRIFLFKTSKLEKKINLYTRSILSILLVLLAILILKENFNLLILVSLIYYSNFLINLIFAFKHYHENKILAIGLLLFIICDTLIGLHEVTSIFNLNETNFLFKLTHTPINIPWVFYIPAQTLLVYSLKPSLRN